MAIYRHLLSGTTPGEIWSFSMHTDSALDVDAAHAAWTTAVSGFWDDGTPSMAQYFPEEVIGTETSTALLSGATGLQVSRRVTGVTLPGLNTAAMLPFQVSVCVSLRTDLATRAGRGRFYLPPLSTAQVLDGRLLAADQSNIADNAQAFLQALLSAGLEPVIWGRTSLNATTITSVDVGDVFDTQRRRRNALIETRESRAV